jgi:hypothetical protein
MHGFMEHTPLAVKPGHLPDCIAQSNVPRSQKPGRVHAAYRGERSQCRRGATTKGRHRHAARESASLLRNADGDMVPWPVTSMLRCGDFRILLVFQRQLRFLLIGTESNHLKVKPGSGTFSESCLPLNLTSCPGFLAGRKLGRIAPPGKILRPRAEARGAECFQALTQGLQCFWLGNSGWCDFRT